jgi:hypothetical protein
VNVVSWILVIAIVTGIVVNAIGTRIMIRGARRGNHRPPT